MRAAVLERAARAHGPRLDGARAPLGSRRERLDRPLALARLALALAPLAGACASVPAFTEASALGPVRADSPELARVVARAAEAGRAELAAWLPDLRSDEIEILVQERLSVGGGVEVREDDGGLTWTRGEKVRVYLRSDEIENVLLHELVHASLGGAWKTLPAAAEEGLCELASVRDGARPDWRRALLRAAARTGPAPVELSWIDPEHGGERRVKARWISAGGLDGTGARRSAEEVLSLRELRELDGNERDHAYGVGFACVERIVARTGTAGLHALCVRAERDGHELVPLDVLLGAAGFASGPELEAWAATELSLERARMLLALDSFWETLDVLHRVSGGSLARMLAEHRPRLAIANGPSVSLVELPGFLEAARVRWPGTREAE